jgi:hypothetical protein
MRASEIYIQKLHFSYIQKERDMQVAKHDSACMQCKHGSSRACGEIHGFAPVLARHARAVMFRSCISRMDLRIEECMHVS